MSPDTNEIKGTVSSIRLDSVLSLAYPLSRSKLTAYIEAGKVFVNGKLITSNGYHLKEGDIHFCTRAGTGSMYEGTLLRRKKGVIWYPSENIFKRKRGKWYEERTITSGTLSDCADRHVAAGAIFWISGQNIWLYAS